MKISKRDARMWMEFFACLPEEEGLLPRQQEIALAVLAQIEAAADARAEALRREIPGLKSLEGRTEYVGSDAKFPPGCRSCLLGTGPVSYTHLDVYKRQILRRRWTPGAARWRCRSNRFSRRSPWRRCRRSTA